MWAFAGNDKLFCGAGFDNLIGGRGKDTYDGGTSSGDIDQLSFDDTYSDAKGAKGVSVDMAKGADIDPWGNHETFKNIERIKGTQFADKFLGSAGDDQFRGLGGKDQIDGRGGEDTVRYDRDAGHEGAKGVKVDLAVGTAIDGFGDKDTLKSIENVVGSAFKDTLNGNGVANRLAGGAGQDTLFGGAGADTFVFGDGFGRDTIKEFHAAGKGHDFIDLSDFSLAQNFADLKANIIQHGQDVWIAGEVDDILVLKGREVADLVKTDFIF